MPQETFHKLRSDKKKLIKEAFLREFSIKSYDDASVTHVVKALGIAKGSIYQYFADKMDLFLYLHSECNAVKMNYVANIQREDYPDFWTFYRALYEKGINFDINHPLESNFLHNLANHINSPSLKELTKQWMEQVIDWMSVLIRHEVDQGYFRKDMPVKSMAFLLFKTSSCIGEYMQAVYGLNPEKQIRSGKPVYADRHGEILLKAVDEYIFLLKNAFNKSKYDKS